MPNPAVEIFFDKDTFTASYVVADRSTKRAAIIDAVLDFDAASGRTTTENADRIIAYVESQNLTVDWVLETHIHADHLSAGDYLKTRLGGRTGVGDKVGLVQKIFGEIFNAGSDFNTDGRQFDCLFADDETFSIGELQARVMHVPGHTPACIAYVIGDAAFVGDTLFMPDSGTARCDFPGGDAESLYRSIEKILALPDETRIFTCHDYKAPGRNEFAFQSSVREQCETNIHIAGNSAADFVAMREERDATLSMPKLILPAVQVNMRAGALPPADDNGVSYLKIPVNAI